MKPSRLGGPLKWPLLLCLLASCIGDVNQRSLDGKRGTTIVGGSLSSAFAATGCILSKNQAYCTATLVAPNKILSAAHCVTGSDVDPISGMEFALGPDPTSSTIRVKITNVQWSPRYSENGDAGDISVLTLERNITEVLPAVLGFDDAAQLVNKQMLFVGYGDDEKQQGAGTRRQAAVTLTNASAELTEYAFVSTGHCYGDSGGPGFVQVGSDWRQMGVISSGNDGSEAGSVCKGNGFNTRIDVNVAWLQQVGITSGERTRQCGSDGVCDGACYTDPDCATLFPGSGTTPADPSTPSTPSCGEDGSCNSQCGAGVDPDCDGTNTPGIGGTDPCGQNGLCNSSCGYSDPDCFYDDGSSGNGSDPCAQDGQCNWSSCGDLDPDCYYNDGSPGSSSDPCAQDGQCNWSSCGDSDPDCYYNDGSPGSSGGDPCAEDGQCNWNECGDWDYDCW